MHELFAACLHKLLERHVDADFRRGDDAPEELLQSISCQEVRVGYGDAEGVSMVWCAVCRMGMFHVFIVSSCLVSSPQCRV